MAAISIALVEDHAATRAVLSQVLRDAPERLKLVDAYPDAESFLRALPRLDVTIVLVDLGLPGMSGAELISKLGTTSPSLKALALTAFDTEEQVIEAIHAGAYGYLLKDEAQERLVSAIEEAAAGAHPISSRVAGFLISHARRAPALVTLSDREEELAIALSEGLSYSECATRMGIALGTVQDYVKRLYRKLDVNSKKELRHWVSVYVTPLKKD